MGKQDFLVARHDKRLEAVFEAQRLVWDLEPGDHAGIIKATLVDLFRTMDDLHMDQKSTLKAAQQLHLREKRKYSFATKG